MFLQQFVEDIRHQCLDFLAERRTGMPAGHMLNETAF